MAHPGYYAQPYYYKSGFYGGPYTGELRDPAYYPPGYRHVSPVHRQSKLDTLDPYGKVYLKQKEWKLSTGFNTSKEMKWARILKLDESIQVFHDATMPNYEDI